MTRDARVPCSQNRFSMEPMVLGGKKGYYSGTSLALPCLNLLAACHSAAGTSNL